MSDIDVLIIGSGPSGVHAALPLVEAGLRVAIVDGGLTPPAFTKDLTDRNYEDIRTSDPNQHQLFLGKDFSGIPVNGPNGGAMLGGNRSYITRGVAENFPTETNGAQVLQTLAQGGLGAAWGGECGLLNDNELQKIGLSSVELHDHLKAVATEIGIAGTSNELPLQAPIKLDHHGEAVMQRAAKNAAKLAKLKFQAEPTAIAALTSPLKDRKPMAYTDMEYYLDNNRTVYRPQYTLEELLKRPNVEYFPESIAEDIAYDNGTPATTIRSVHSANTRIIRSKKVILAAGAVGSARIALSSLNLLNTPVPFLAKDHTFIICLHPATFGVKGPKERTTLCQVAISSTETGWGGLPSSYTQLYSYRSFKLFRLLSSSPLALPSSMRLLSLIAPSMMIADVRFPEVQDSQSTLMLMQMADGKKKISIHIERSKEELQARKAELKRIKKSLKAVGLLPVKVMDLPVGSSSHYAGTIPMTDDGSTFPLSADRTGQVRGLPHVYVADASSFNALPAKPHTFTLMANARRIGKNTAQTSN